MLQEEPWRKPRTKVDHYESPGVRERLRDKAITVHLRRHSASSTPNTVTHDDNT